MSLLVYLKQKIKYDGIIFLRMKLVYCGMRKGRGAMTSIH